MGSKKKLIVFGIEIVVILAMMVVLYFVMKQPDNSGVSIIDIQSSEVINSEVVQKQEEKAKKAEEEGKTVTQYMNIALFGVDATLPNQLYKGSRSDCIMIASLNLDTYEMRLVSVYRDSYLNLSNDSYSKCNGAYTYGGAPQSLKMLNMNLDLDITKFITVGYKALSETIDALGGVYIDISAAEMEWINGYQQAVIEVLKQKSYTPVTKTGYQLVNGVQATAYCRIRYSDNDFKRTARQREVLLSMQEQAKKVKDPTLLAKIFKDIADDIYMSFDEKEILEFLPKIGDIKVVAQDGFPQEDMREVATIGKKGSCVIPMDLEKNVQWLHKYLFDDEDYSVTSTVKEISAQIKSDTSSYINREY